MVVNGDFEKAILFFESRENINRVRDYFTDINETINLLTIDTKTVIQQLLVRIKY